MNPLQKEFDKAVLDEAVEICREEGKEYFALSLVERQGYLDRARAELRDYLAIYGIV